MRHLSRKSVRLALSAAVLLAAAGCRDALPVAQAASDVSSVPEYQFIVKFRPDTITCDAAGIARLAAEAHVPLEFVRPMSGEACVVKQKSGVTDKPDRNLDILRRHPAVEWAEPDARMRAQ